ncbi:uncharacterized protein N7484_001806 [Penicillium longicatenatum]|uniref:uncharacterized protein n=1 Tax=Penicillium longicatenatum TaxID=1561947 RepID=UPI002547E949|nr:uncharacterized protein N7484_001806 [Penicillium longicatenatum]KAJ5658157.1 hypothetical protein N7484_001806 [Penicillium longicatenatum]
MQLSRPIKHLATGIVAACAASTPLGSNILLPALAGATRDLHTTPTIMNLSIAFYCLAVALTPLWWSTLSQHKGCRNTFIVSFFLFIIFNILAAVSNSAGMFIAMRLLAGATSAPVQSLGAATVAQLWSLDERGRAMGIFLLGSMCGTVFGPIIGGALTTHWNWRSTQWFMAIYGFMIWLTVLLFLPETSRRPNNRDFSEGESRNVLSRRIQALWSTLVAPIGLLRLLRFPPILLTILYTSVTFASYYSVMIVIQATFSTPPYSFNAMIVSLLYLPNGIGYGLAGTLGGRWNDRDMLAFNAWSAAIVYPLAVLCSGWASQEHAPWPVICVANFFFAFGNMMVLSITTVMLTEFVPSQPSTGMALSNLVRNTFGAVACVVVQPLINAIGVGWLLTITAVICLAGAPSLWFLQRNANRWSAEMREIV